MCLCATLEKVRDDPAPRRRKAWKVVCKDRTPSIMTSTGVHYRKGSTHRMDEEEIIKNRRRGSYFYGFHVFTSLARAKEKYKWYEEAKIIEVQVSAKDWIAENSALQEAVYAKLKVLT